MSKTNAEDIQLVDSSDKKLEIKTTQKYMLDMLLMLVAPAVMAWYYYGERAVRLIVISVITALLSEIIGSKIFKINATVSDFSAVITGVMVALCVSAASPWWLACIASGFAIIVGKLPFGNSRSHLFVPACVGLAFVTICNQAEMFSYSVIPNGTIGLEAYGTPGFVAGNSIAKMLMERNSIGVNIISYIDILVGNVAGAMGTTCGVAMLGALVFLIIRRPKTAVIPVSFLFTCAVYAFLFPRVTTGRMISVVMELTGGLLFFSALFFLTDEAIAPKRTVAKVCYGVVGGLVAMLLRSFGKFEDSTVFAILLVNCIAPVFDSKIPFLKSEMRKLKKQTENTAKTQSIEKVVGIAKSIEENVKIATVDLEQVDNADTENENEQLASDEEQQLNEEPNDDVPTLQDLNDVGVTEQKEDGGDDNVR